MRLRTALLLLAAGVALGSGLLAASDLPDGEPLADVTVASAPIPEPEPALARARPARPFPSPEPEPGLARARPARPLTPPEPEPAPEPVARPVTDPFLADRIARLLEDPALPTDERLGVVVVDGRGRVLAAHDADVALIPASTQKLVTAAAALRILGADHRFRTEVRATAAPDARGTVDGDLVLVGGGDPALATRQYSRRVYPARPRTRLAALADRVHAAGVRHVRGRLVADSSWLSDEPEAPGWPERYLRQGHTTRSSGLTVNAGRRVFTNGGRLYSAPADDPALEAVEALAELLEDRGVTIERRPAAPRTPAEAPHEIAAVESPPLGELLRFTVQRSDNHFADTIYRALGRVEGDGSWASGGQAVRAALDELGLDWDGTALVDGSGLSRDDRLTARFLVALDRDMTRVAGAQWQELMAVSGSSGTLRRRLVGTVADGRVLGKTGSLIDVRSLSGAVVGPNGRRYHFAVIGNGLDTAEDAAVRRLQDELLVALAEDLHGCVWVPTATSATDGAADEDADEDAGPAARLRCAA